MDHLTSRGGVYYTQVKKKIFKSQYWYTILEQIFIPVLCTILVYQYCDRQVQEILVVYCDVLLMDVINANKMIHNELVLLVCFSTVDSMNLLI
jgi:hypothetical protein